MRNKIERASSQGNIIQSFEMIALLLVVKLIATFVLADNYNEPSPSELTRRVFSGEIARIEDYSYFASLGDCGGVILSQMWVATAAHCVDNAQTRNLQQIVYVGGNTIKDSVTRYYTDFIVHPEYKEIVNNGILINDIALLKLNAPLQFTERIQPAKLPISSAPKNVILVTRGSDETGKASQHLRKVDRIVLSAQECLSLMTNSDHVNYAKRNMQQLQKVMLCTRKRQNLQSVCRGDSGSPLLSNNTVIGLISFGNSICEEGRLVIATNILNYVPWCRSHWTMISRNAKFKCYLK